NSRRGFNCLTDLGKVIFLRTCKWAMGETLTPYQPLGLIRVSKVGNQQIRLEWDGKAAKNYKILGTRNLFGPPDFSNWQTVAEKTWCEAEGSFRSSAWNLPLLPGARPLLNPTDVRVVSLIDAISETGGVGGLQ